MKKTLLILLTLTPLLLAEQSALSAEDRIANTKAQIAQLQANLVKLEASLPKDMEKEKALVLAKQAKKYEFKTHTEFGFIKTSGNTNTTTYNLDLNLKKNWDEHAFELSFDSQYADDNGIQTKNKYLTELEYDYKFPNKFSFNYLIGYKQDKFSGYDYQAYTGPGIKYKAIEEEKQNLSLEGNILYSEDELENPNSTRRYSSFRTKGVYEFQVFENLKFTQDLSYRSEIEDSKNYFVFSKTAFSSKIYDIFSFSISYKVDYVNTPPKDTGHSDKTLTANLIVDY